MSDSWYTIAIRQQGKVFTLENEYGDCTLYLGDEYDFNNGEVLIPNIKMGVELLVYNSTHSWMSNSNNSYKVVVEVINNTYNTCERAIITSSEDLKEYLERITYYSV